MISSWNKQQRANDEKRPHSVRIFRVYVLCVKQSADYDHNGASNEHDYGYQNCFNWNGRILLFKLQKRQNKSDLRRMNET